MKRLRFFPALAFFLLCAWPARAANDVYIAQTAAGAGTGVDCADAVAQSYFNSPGNWSPTPTGIQIGPDTTVHLCGTFSETGGASGTLTAQGSGASGHPVRIQFETSANATAPYWGPGGFITINGKGFIQIDGSPTSTPCGNVNHVNVSCNGLIQATANGAALANHVANGHGISLGSGTHDIETRNLDCENLFVAVQNSANNESTNGINNSACVWWYPSAGGGGGNINTHNIKVNYSFNGVLYAYQGSNAGMHADNMWCTNIDTCAQIGAGSSGASITAGSWNNNDASNMAPWDTPGDRNHHEFIHLYTQQPGATISNFTIVGNYVHGTLGAFMTSEIYVECDGGGSCTAPTSINVEEYNNVIVNEDPNADISLGTGGNGMNECEGSTCQIYNNTYFSLAHYSSNNFAQHLEAGSVVTARGNIFDGMWQAFANGGGTLTASTNLGFGLNVACGSSCSSSGNPLLNLASSPPYQLQAGSAAIGAAPNLTALGITGLDSDQLGSPRPSIGFWDMGAFNGGGSPSIAFAPSSLAYGNQTVGGSPTTKSVTLSNPGSATLLISGISITGTNAGDFTQTNTCGGGVSAGGSCSVAVVFTAHATGARSANVSVADNAAGSPHTVPLTGTGISTAPAVTFSQPGGLGFGNVVLGNPVLVVQHFKNTGNATLTISGPPAVGGTNASMVAAHTTCGATLAAGSSCEISVIFTPTSTGAKSATVSVTDNAANSPQVFSVTGTGVTGTSPTRDQYGGTIASPCANITGRFHVEQIANQWTYCTPLGNSFFLLGVYVVDFAGNAGYQSKIISKYGSALNWAVPTLQRIQSWGFNSPYYSESAEVAPFATSPSYPADPNGLHSIPIKMPVVIQLRPGLYGMRNPVFNPTSQFPTGQMLPIGSTIKNMAAGWSPIYYNPGNFVPPTGEADYYDPNLTTFSNNFLGSQEVNPTTSPYSDYIIGVAYDDGDQVFGFGAGPDFATTPVGHNNPNLGWLAATMSPTQVASSLYPAVYTNTQVYTKAAWQTYLQGKYGTIGALNTAWGSSYTTFGSSGTNFTGEAVGTGDGTTATFTHTLAHLTPTPFTAQILVNGVVIGGDLGHGTTETLFGCSPAVTPVQTMSGTLVVSTGALTVTFVTPPPTGAAITVNYQQGGWQVGTGLMDEDGRSAHQAWLSGNPFTLAGANANTATDLNTFFFQMASQYLGVGHTALAAALPGYLFLGPDTIGSWQAPPARQVLQAVPGNLDVITGSIQQPGGANYQAQLDFIFTYAGNMPQQQGEYLHANPDSPFASNPLPGDYTTQFLRGQAYANIVVNGKTAAYTSNSAKPVIASSAFDFLDLASEQTNWGLVTLLDNAYDGNEATTGTVTCSPPLQAYSCGGQAGTYGNYISCVTQANFTDTICSGTGTPTVSLSTASLSFANQIIGTASNPQVVIVTNTGTGALNISSVAITGANQGDFGQNNTCSLPVGPSKSCTVSVVFTPTAPGLRGASVTITDNASGSPHAVALSGAGVAGPVVAPDPGAFATLRIVDVGETRIAIAKPSETRLTIAKGRLEPILQTSAKSHAGHVQ